VLYLSRRAFVVVSAIAYFPEVSWRQAPGILLCTNRFAMQKSAGFLTLLCYIQRYCSQENDVAGMELIDVRAL
jgi:hypothetical protein